SPAIHQHRDRRTIDRRGRLDIVLQARLAPRLADFEWRVRLGEMGEHAGREPVRARSGILSNIDNEGAGVGHAGQSAREKRAEIGIRGTYAQADVADVARLTHPALEDGWGSGCRGTRAL